MLCYVLRIIGKMFVPVIGKFSGLLEAQSGIEAHNPPLLLNYWLYLKT